MFCPKCGRINPDENEVCKGCGAALHPDDEDVAQKPKSSPAKKWVIALVAVIVIAIAVFVGIQMLG